jgi:predicted transcriptional regulator
MPLQIEHLMTRDVITIESGSSLKDAVELMNKHEIGCIIVMERGKPRGIITERDLLKKVLINVEEVKALSVDDIMSEPLTSARPEEKVEEAARTMLTKRIKKLPIIKDGHLVGVVTLTDLFRFEPELIKSYTILMRARIEPNVLDPTNVKSISP